MAGVAAKDIDLVIVATVTPDMSFPSAGALIADELGMPDAAAYDLSAGCTGFVYAIAQAHGMLAAGLAGGRSWSGATCCRRSSTEDRSTLVLFGDGAGAVVMERVERAASSGSSSAQTAAAAPTCGCRAAAHASSTIPRST